MRVLMISGDAKALEKDSAIFARLEMQASQVDRLVVFVRAPREGRVLLGSHGEVRGFSGSKVGVFFRMLFEKQSTKVDVVTAQDPFFLGLVAWIISLFRDSVLQLQIHTDLFAPEFVSRNRIKVVFAKFLLRRADLVRVVSERIRESLVPLRLRARVSVLPVFIDRSAVENAVAGDLRGRYARFSHRVLVVSRLESEKNVEASLQAMQEVLAIIPTAGLLVVGDGSQRGMLERRARDLSIADRVVFLGFQKDIFSFYKSVDVLLVTSWYEGFGASIVEALAAGCPVVSPDIGVAREAGATVVPRDHISRGVISTLQSGARGELHMSLLSPEEYAQKWKETLVA